MKKPIKLAIIGARGVSTPFSGIERQCEEVYSRLVEEENFDVCVYSRTPYVNREIEYHRGIQQKHIPCPQHKHLEAFIHSFLSTCHAMWSDADILHFHAQGPTIFSWLPRLLTPHKKVVFTCHGLDWQRAKWGMIASLTLRAGEWCSAYFPHARIGLSQSDIRHYEEHYKKPLHRIPNGTNAWNLPAANLIKEKFGLEAKRYFIFVGRLVPEKGIDELIQAYKILDTDIKLVITGDSSSTCGYVRDLKELAGDDPRICFTSFAYGELLDELFTNALAYVSPSHLEGLPLTLLEALSHQIPVVLSNIPAHQEILETALKTHPCGWLYECRNIPALSATLETVLDTPTDTLEAWGINAREYVLEHFSWDNIAKQYAQLYRTLMEAEVSSQLTFDQVNVPVIT